MPLIKRYPNRKLYDTKAKRYVTLDEITEMIRAGADIQVIDYESGDDLTSLTLTQIILEQEKKSSGFLPRTLLTSLIRTGGDTLEGVVRSVQSGLGVSAGDHDDFDLVIPGEEDRIADSSENASHLDQKRTDERLSDVLHMLNVPSRRDVDTLQQQLALLTERLDELVVGQKLQVDEEPSVDDADAEKKD
jgi:polyhydroxyalkanoate synthesis repressor PhaR